MKTTIILFAITELTNNAVNHLEHYVNPEITKEFHKLLAIILNFLIFIIFLEEFFLSKSTQISLIITITEQKRKKYNRKSYR